MGAPAFQRLGEFELLRELGRGGMGVVYEAVQTSLGRHVALKVLGPGLGLTPQAVTRFRREAAAAAKLHHTNIVPVYATGEEDGTHFYAMELVEGPSLDRVLKQLRESGGKATEAPLPGGQTIAYAEGPGPAAEAAGLSSSSLSSGGQYFDAVARMVAGVADALDYAHKQGVVHRDIKPANLLLAPDGRLSLNDFGLARMLEQPGMTVTGEFLGTPAYMSPEQITGGRVPTDHRTDVYSLGATLYELLTLRPPFAGMSRDQVLAQILHKEPTPPRKVNPRVPVDLETICLKCLEKDPDRRYPTAGALAEDLRRFLNRFAISAKRAGPVARAVKWARRQPGLAAALAGMLLALVAVGFFAWQSHRTEHLRRDELRRAALDKAMTAALIGDFDAAKRATTEAQRLGAEEWEVWLLNGFLNFHTGRTKEALADFRQAVELRPDSMMAQSLLSYAYGAVAEWSKTQETLQRLESLTPRTTEDRLFKGFALASILPESGLPLMDEAIRERPSTIAYLLRAGPRARRAEDTAAVADAEAAVDDAELAKRLLPDRNPVALTSNVYARLVAATAYRVHGQMLKSDEALRPADHDLEILKNFPENPEAVWARVTHRMYSDYLAGRVTDVVAEFRSARERIGIDSILWGEALNLFRLGRDREALEVLDASRRGEYAAFLHAFLLREVHDDLARARAAMNQIPIRDGDTSTWVRRYNHLLLLGETGAAAKEARTFRQSGQTLFWYPQALAEVMVNYFADDGRATEGDLIRACGGRRMMECNGYHSIGLRHLVEGERHGAKTLFRSSADTLSVGASAWHYSVTFLTRMERDAQWPRWIPVKK
jgi:tetratricopeptide (TPR) repeat protein